MSRQAEMFDPLDRPLSRQSSREAYGSVVGDLPRQHGEVFAAIRAAGRNGLTCDEFEVAHRYAHQTASARFNELATRFQVIEESGERRRTRSGRFAAVWVAKAVKP